MTCTIFCSTGIGWQAYHAASDFFDRHFKNSDKMTLVNQRKVVVTCPRLIEVENQHEAHRPNFASRLFFLALAPSCAGDTRVQLIPELHAGQTITYLIRYRSDKNVKTESNVVAPMAPNAAQWMPMDCSRSKSSMCSHKAAKPRFMREVNFGLWTPACG